MGRCILTLTRVILEGEYQDSIPLDGAKSGKLNVHLKWNAQPIYRESWLISVNCCMDNSRWTMYYPPGDVYKEHQRHPSLHTCLLIHRHGKHSDGVHSCFIVPVINIVKLSHVYQSNSRPRPGITRLLFALDCRIIDLCIWSGILLLHLWLPFIIPCFSAPLWFLWRGSYASIRRNCPPDCRGKCKLIGSDATSWALVTLEHLDRVTFRLDFLTWLSGLQRLGSLICLHFFPQLQLCGTRFLQV